MKPSITKSRNEKTAHLARFLLVEAWGFEPQTLRLQSGCSPAELSPLSGAQISRWRVRMARGDAGCDEREVRNLSGLGRGIHKLRGFLRGDPPTAEVLEMSVDPASIFRSLETLSRLGHSTGPARTPGDLHATQPKTCAGVFTVIWAICSCEMPRRSSSGRMSSIRWVGCQSLMAGKIALGIGSRRPSHCQMVSCDSRMRPA